MIELNSEENDIDVIKEKLKEIIRQAAESRTRVHARDDNFALVERSNNTKIGQIQGNWMSLILITGDPLKITLKLHFSHTDIKNLIHPFYSAESANDISDQQSMDFIKELSNLTAGYLEQAFSEMSVPLGISLPLATRGYYEIFSDYTPSNHPIIKLSDLWCIENDNTKIVGSVLMEITNADALKNLLTYETATTEDDDEGEFDFL